MGEETQMDDYELKRLEAKAQESAARRTHLEGLGALLRPSGYADPSPERMSYNYLQNLLTAACQEGGGRPGVGLIPAGGPQRHCEFDSFDELRLRVQKYLLAQLSKIELGSKEETNGSTDTSGH